MAQIPPILDEYIDEVIKSSGDYVATKNKTQGIKLRELIKKLRDYFEQEIPKRTSDLINDSDFVVQDFLKELPEEGNSKRPFIIRPLANFDPDEVFGTNGQPVHMMLIATEEVNGKIVPAQMKIADGVTPFKDLKNLIAEIDLSGKEDISHKATTLTDPNDITYPTTQAVSNELTNKANLVGGNDFTGNQKISDGASNSINITANDIILRSNIDQKVSLISSRSFSVVDDNSGNSSELTEKSLEILDNINNASLFFGQGKLEIFSNNIKVKLSSDALEFTNPTGSKKLVQGENNTNVSVIALPENNGTLALTSQIPNISGKLDKITTSTAKTQLYAKKADGSQGMLDVDASASGLTETDTSIATSKLVKIKLDEVLNQKGQALGLATLDNTGKVPVSQLPDAILGSLQFQSQWNASTNTPVIPTASAQNKGHFYITQTAGVYNSVSYNVGDWILSNGTGWEKISNSDTVTSVFGRIGNVVAAVGDYTSDQILNQSSIFGYYITDALEQLNNDKATDTNVVHKTGDEYITGNKVFESIQIEAVKITDAVFQPGDGDPDDIYDQKLQRKNGTIALTSDIPTPIDISGKEDKSNKAINLTSPDDVKYPTTQAVSSALAVKANDADVMHKTGDETITGVKTFTKAVKLGQGTRTFDTRRTAGTLFPDQATILTYPKNMQYGYEAIGSNVITGAIMLKVPLYDLMFSIDLLVEHWSATGSDYSFIKMKLDGYNWGANGTWALGNATIIDGYGHLLTDFKNKNVIFGKIAENSGKAFTPIIKIGEVTDTYSNVELNIIVERITINNDKYNNAADDYLSTRMYTSADLPTITTGLNRTVQVANWLNLPASETIATTSDIPKMMVVTATADGNITYSFPHGLIYTPTMVVVTANSDGTAFNGEKGAPLTSSAKINGANIDITIAGVSVVFGENVGPEFGSELKWTVWVK
ncbi:hypothetical protein [Pedobacter sp.]|uniref:hypothetical protein n=1 Tax=Pedobacter sp. TaxID=1411316 RepID=UPI00396CDB6A